MIGLNSANTFLDRFNSKLKAVIPQIYGVLHALLRVIKVSDRVNTFPELDDFKTQYDRKDNPYEYGNRGSPISPIVVLSLVVELDTFTETVAFL